MTSDKSRLVGSRFELRRRLGMGGMGIVYEALDRESDKVVALKTLKFMDPSGLLRFKREFRALQDLVHENLVRLEDLVEDDGQWFFTMELVHGIDLVRYLRGAQAATALDNADVRPSEDTMRGEQAAPAGPSPVDVGQLRAIFAQLARGLAALHHAGKIHRDVKPTNVMVTDEGRVVLLDFGLVMEHDDHRSTEGIVGTAEYMAPEQAASKPMDAAADCYSLGVILYEALTGVLPFAGAPLQIILAKQQGTPKPPTSSTDDPDRRELGELCMRLLAFDPSNRPTAEQIVLQLAPTPVFPRAESPRPAPPATPTPPFLGRDAELLALRDAYHSARTGGAAMVLVTGESGIGKSELVRTFVANLEAGPEPPIILSGRCYEREAVPYKAFDGVADNLSRLLVRLPASEVDRLMPRRAGLLGRLFPVLTRVPAIGRQWEPEPSGGGRDANVVRERMFSALRELLERLAERQRVIITIDDLQWTDRDSLVLLEDVLRAPTPLGLLVIATARATEAEELDRLVPVPLRAHVIQVPLRSLSPTYARSLMATMLPQLARSRPQAIDELVAESAGHPFFLLELARHGDDFARTTGAAPLEEALWRRIERLSQDARTLLDLLAVAGAPLTRGVALDAFGGTPTAYEQATTLLRVECFSRSVGHDGRGLVTYHDRIREAVLARLSDDERRKVHGRLAEALEWAGAATHDPRALVRHLAGAGEPLRAARRAETAARLAMDAMAFELAAELYETALALGDAKGPERQTLLFARAQALANERRGLEAAEAFLEAAKNADAAMRLGCLNNAAEQLFISGYLERGSQLLNEIFAGSGGLSAPRTPRGALALMLTERFLLKLRGYRWKRRPVHEIDPAATARLDSAIVLGMSYSHVDPVWYAAFATRCLREALALGDPRRVTQALYLEAGYLAAFGGTGRAKARKLLDQLDRETPLDDAFLVAFGRGIRGAVAYFDGNFDESIRFLEAAEEEARDAIMPTSVMTWVRNSLIFSLLHAGRLRRLRAYFETYLRDAQRRGDLNMESMSRHVCSVTALADDRPDEARRLMKVGGWTSLSGMYHLQEWWRLEAHVQLALYEGASAARLEELHPALRECERSLLSRVEAVSILRSWLEARLLLAAAPGHPRAAALRRRARRCIRQVAKSTMASSQVWAALALAALAWQEGRPDGARAELRGCIASAEANIMSACAAIARHRLAAMVGADEASELERAAQEWATNEGVVRLDRFAEVLAPGFGQVDRT